MAALRIINARGEIIVLPFQGQQIWRANFDGRDLTLDFDVMAIEARTCECEFCLLGVCLLELGRLRGVTD